MKRRRRKRVRRIVFTAVNIAIPLAILLFLWTYSVEEEARYAPNYPKEDISDYLGKEELSEEDYGILFRQTGLTELGIDTLWKKNRREEILAVQERFFRQADVQCERSFCVFREILEEPKSPKQRILQAETLDLAIPAVENGDILITFNSHFLGWRNGHAALVVDAEKGLTLEAITLGKNSSLCSLRGWTEWPSFVVLRLTELSERERSVVADYAKRNLKQIPYSLTAGIWDEEEGELEDALQGDDALGGTQCAHLIWYAYNHFGYDLDSNGGMLVTPEDIYESSLLEVVQVYGVKIE